MASAEPLGGARAEPGRRGATRRLGTPAIALAVAGGTYAGVRADASYETTQWPLLGLTLLAAAWLLVCAGRRPQRIVVASTAALAALGCWTLASPLWGGLPDAAWTAFDGYVLAGAALLIGALAGPRRANLVATGVLIGITAQATEILTRTAIAGTGTSWFFGRVLDGPVGYHNAQGALCAVALPLAVFHFRDGERLRRVGGALAGAALLSTLLLTQSRGALGATVIALAVQMALTRDRRVSLGVISLVAVGAVLAVPLRRVDAALASGGPPDQIVALRWYVFASACSAALLVAVAVLDVERVPRLRRSTVATALVAVVVVTASAAIALHRPLMARATAFAAQFRSDATPATSPGATRFTSMTANGRLQAWRVAARAIRSEPVTGIGAGQFTRRWIKERESMLYIVQPHSIELEIASETGVVGLALFIVFATLLLAALVRAPARATAAAATAAFAALLLQASLDWTWSFPGLVAPVLLVAGTVPGHGSDARLYPRRLVAVAATVVAVLAAAFAAPYLAEMQRKAAVAVASSNPTAAARHVRFARRLDPWAAAVVEVEGRLAESRGAFALAASRYRHAASLSRHAWLDEFLAARMFARIGANSARDAACRVAAAENPLEPLIRQKPCAATLARSPGSSARSQKKP